MSSESSLPRIQLLEKHIETIYIKLADLSKSFLEFKSLADSIKSIADENSNVKSALENHVQKCASDAQDKNKSIHDLSESHKDLRKAQWVSDKRIDDLDSKTNMVPGQISSLKNDISVLKESLGFALNSHQVFSFAIEDLKKDFKNISDSSRDGFELHKLSFESNKNILNASQAILANITEALNKHISDSNSMWNNLKSDIQQNKNLSEQALELSKKVPTQVEVKSNDYQVLEAKVNDMKKDIGVFLGIAKTNLGQTPDQEKINSKLKILENSIAQIFAYQKKYELGD